MDEAAVCSRCGCPCAPMQYQYSPVNVNTNPADTGSFGWAVLGFFIPLVGLILYLVWQDSRPKDASKAGKGALTGFIINIVLGIIYGVAVSLMFFTLY